MQPEGLRFSSLAMLAALALLTSGCSVWQLGDDGSVRIWDLTATTDQ